MKSENTQLATFSLEPRTLAEAQDYAKLIANSDMVPPDYKGKAGNVLVAVQMGMEIGLKPLQALQNIAVINGRPSIWGDALIAVVRNSPLCEYVKESFDEQKMVATCKVKRRDHDEEVRTFSKGDAELARLWGKQGPWTQYPKRMLQMRARAFALRDVFGDLLKGLSVGEEARDMVNITEESRIYIHEGNMGEQQQEAPEEPTMYGNDAFKANFPKWEKMIKDGKKTADDIITTVETKGLLTDDQKLAIKDVQAEVQEAVVVSDE